MNHRIATLISRVPVWPRLLASVLLLPALLPGPAAQAQAVETSTAAAAANEEVPVADQLGVGAWIWTTNAADKQTCRLWRAFTVPDDAPLARAILRITADNGYRIFLDGREIGRGGDWKYLTEYDLTSLMAPGLHVLAVEAFNDALDAGVILGLRMRPVRDEVGAEGPERVAGDQPQGVERTARPACRRAPRAA